MSYQVLSRKWRPQQFDEVVGQLHVTRTLQNAISMDRVAHGYLFCGPRGVGKTTTARILSKVLNCGDLRDNNPCGSCTNCLEITKGSSLDVQELDGASNRGIDEIRDLREAVKYPPNSGKYRIYIIDEVHMLTREAFNALLKTLEEPPPHVIFIMATTDPHKVPATITSRTQRFDFKPISNQKISEYLIQILEKENISFESEGIVLIAQKANGSLRDSLSLLDQVIAYADNKLDVEIIRDVLGIIKENIFLEIIQTLGQKDNKKLLALVNQLVDGGVAISDLISGFNEYLRSCMLQKAGNAGNIILSAESLNWLQSECRFSTADFLRMLDVSLQFESNLKFIQQPVISLEALFLKLSMMDTSIDITQVISGKKPLINPNNSPETDLFNASKSNSADIEKFEEDTPPPKKSEDNQNTTKIAEPDPPAQKFLTLEDIKNHWAAVLSELENNNSKIAHFLEEAEIKEFTDNQIVIEIVNGQRFHLKTLEKDAPQIETVMNNVFKQKIRIKFHIQEKSENESEEKKQPKNPEHPLFMKVLETFEGEIIR